MQGIGSMLEIAQKNLKNTKDITLQPSEQAFLEKTAYECNLCKDKEFILKYVDDDWIAKPCQCREYKKMRRLIKASGITEMLRKKTFANFTPTKKQKLMYGAAIDYIKNYPSIKQKH